MQHKQVNLINAIVLDEKWKKVEYRWYIVFTQVLGVITPDAGRYSNVFTTKIPLSVIYNFIIMKLDFLELN